MSGTLFIRPAIGRKLRQQAALTAADLIDWAGEFRAGDAVHVVVRGNDGGQGVLARGKVRCDAAALVRSKPGSGAAGADAQAMALTVIAGDDLVFFRARRAAK